MSLEPLKKERLHQQVAEEIKRYILDHELKKGDDLPTETHFAQQLKVNRATVREAIRGLEMIGVLTSRKGGGNGYAVGSLNLSEFARHFTFHLQAEEIDFRDLGETRLLLEVSILPLVAERATEEDFHCLQQAIDLYRKGVAQQDWPTCIMADTRFHETLFKATRNQVLISLSGFLREFFTDVRHTLMNPARGPREQVVQEHQAISDALRRKDVRQAQEIMYATLSVYLSQEETQSEI